jgi:Kdo2-lipid IVA lauroyltransferase/acyltransferase
MISHGVILIMRLLAHVPLPLLRMLGWLLGRLLYLTVASRRRVVQTNLALCFPELGAPVREQLAKRSFVYFAQAWLDRAWLWHGSVQTTRDRLQMKGALNELQGLEPVVIFAPHFVGLDAGWTALTQQLPRTFATIYTIQSNPVMDQWILQGRSRYGGCELFSRMAGVRPVATALRAAHPLYLLPDMNFGPHESVFVPFYGVLAATVPSLARFASLGSAKVVPVVTRLTAQGYVMEVLPAWTDFPTGDADHDATLMNQRLQTFIDTMPAQYYWVHKRFKDRPPGEASVY